MKAVEWLSTESAARHLGYIDPVTGATRLGAFKAFLKRRRAMGRPVKSYQLDGLTRFRPSDLDRLLDPVTAARPRRNRVPAASRANLVGRAGVVGEVASS